MLNEHFSLLLGRFFYFFDLVLYQICMTIHDHEGLATMLSLPVVSQLAKFFINVPSKSPLRAYYPVPVECSATITPSHI